MLTLSTITATIINCANPEWTKSLVNFFGGEKGLILAATLIASISSALTALSIAYIADKSIKAKKVKDLNFVLKKALSEKIDSDAQKTEITINKDDLSVTGDWNELIPCDKIEVVTKDCCLLMIEKNDEGVYKITNYQELLNEEVKLIDDAEAIKSRLFYKDDKTTLKSMTVLLMDSLYDTKGVVTTLNDVTCAYKCIGKYIS